MRSSPWSFYRKPHSRSGPIYRGKVSCTEQTSAVTSRFYGGTSDSITVDCPYDTDGDGACDTGGCSEIGTYWVVNNFMTIYELDENDDDELVTTLYYPYYMSVSVDCDVWGCGEGRSSWASPTSSTNPATEVSADIVFGVSHGSFYDAWSQCGEAAYAETLDEGYLCD